MRSIPCCHAWAVMSGRPVVGVVGGGQLARMMAPAAIGLGITLRVLADRPDDSAAQVIPGAVVGDYRDLSTLLAFARGCDVLTFDHEHVPTQHLVALRDSGVVVRPGPEALVHAQDKGVMREQLGGMGAPVPAWARVDVARAGQRVRRRPTADGRSCSRRRGEDTTARASGSSTTSRRPRSCSRTSRYRGSSPSR